MCGFFIGMLMLFFFAKMMRYHLGYGRCGGGGRWGGGGGRWGGDRWQGRRGGHRGRGPARFLRWVFDDLETTASQERVIEDAVETLRSSMKNSKESFKESIDHLTGAMKAEEFDAESISEAWVSQDKALDEARVKIAETLGEIHATLTDRQRARLVELIERRRFGW